MWQNQRRRLGVFGGKSYSERNLLASTDRAADYAGRVAAALDQARLRVATDTRSEKIGAKIRHHLWQDKVPLVGVVGDKEIDDGTVTVRSRADGDLGTMTVEAFRDLLHKMVDERT